VTLKTINKIILVSVSIKIKTKDNESIKIMAKVNGIPDSSRDKLCS
jgi:hypothetical protein